MLVYSGGRNVTLELGDFQGELAPLFSLRVPRSLHAGTCWALVCCLLLLTGIVSTIARAGLLSGDALKAFGLATIAKARESTKWKNAGVDRVGIQVEELDMSVFCPTVKPVELYWQADANGCPGTVACPIPYENE